MPVVTSFPPSSEVRATSMRPSDALAWLESVLSEVNQQLHRSGLPPVVLQQQLSPEPPKQGEVDIQYNLSLALAHPDGMLEPIDMIDCKSLDGKYLKKKEPFVQEIVAKVRQHVEAKQARGILISASGSKFDVRPLKNTDLAIDAQGFLRINGYRVATLQKDGTAWVLRASVFRSYTISRALETEEGNLTFIDDHLLVHEPQKGMWIDPTVTRSFEPHQLHKNYAEFIASYDQKGYLMLERRALTPEERALWTGIVERLQGP